MPGFNIDSSGSTTQNVMFADNVDFSGSAAPTPKVTTNGQLLIGATAAPNIKVGTLTSPLGTITIGYSSPNITLDTTGQTFFTITFVNHAASPYTVTGTDQFLSVDSTAGVVSILLPNAPHTGRLIYIKDAKGQSATNTITITTVGGVVTIDGQTSQVMANNYILVGVVFDGTSYEIL